ncbi:MAG: DUF134 domain-containing protein [Dethiobacteria bacterium]
MPRPFKPRKVSAMPRYTYFKPTGVPITLLDEVVLTVDELEALRLKDIEKLEQNECAARMHVAQSTLQRILVSAHEKVARAIVEGKVLRIHGGPYALEGERICGRCRRRRLGFNVPGPTGEDCPDCGDKK